MSMAPSPPLSLLPLIACHRDLHSPDANATAASPPTTESNKARPPALPVPVAPEQRQRQRQRQQHHQTTSLCRPSTIVRPHLRF
mmetsp:Transcript_3228/g.7325  ORF Transcript_3228/g.7325 Transcript_3228/m.7325 type:complete len:84 (-) Transcript_3228:98-349(-)